MKKIDINNSVLRQRKIKYDISNNIYNDVAYQLILINNIYNNIYFTEENILKKELLSKINSYKNQDIKKDIHEINNLISFESVVEKLVKSNLKCYYCNSDILVLYDKVRDNRQWTLDRINNYDEHSNNNTIICCLKCNLQRRRLNSDKFKFTKSLSSNNTVLKKIE